MYPRPDLPATQDASKFILTRSQGGGTQDTKVGENENGLAEPSVAQSCESLVKDALFAMDANSKACLRAASNLS